MESMNFKDAYKIYKTNKFLLSLSIVGLVGGVSTLSINFALVAAYFILIFYRGNLPSLLEITKSNEYKRFNEIYQFILAELLSNMKALKIFIPILTILLLTVILLTIKMLILFKMIILLWKLR